MKNEIWKDVIWYEGKYQVSNIWNVMSLNYNHTWKPKLLIPWTNSHWYKIVILSSNNLKKNFSVHRLVALAFIENTYNKETVNHINWIKSDNYLGNLEWATSSENNRHAFRTWLNKNHNFLTNHPGKWKFWAESKSSKLILQFTKDLVFIKE